MGDPFLLYVRVCYELRELQIGQKPDSAPCRLQLLYVGEEDPLASKKKILITVVLSFLWICVVLFFAFQASYVGKVGTAYHFHFEKFITLSFGFTIAPFLLGRVIVRIRFPQKNKSQNDGC